MSPNKVESYFLDVDDGAISYIGYFKGNPLFEDTHEIEDLYSMKSLMSYQDSMVLWI